MRRSISSHPISAIVAEKPSMKLRLKSIQSKEIFKIDAPNSCTVRELKQILSQKNPNSPSPDSIRLSLNREVELESTSPDGEENSLRFLGIVSGDLIFFSVSSDAEGMDSNSVNIANLGTAFVPSKPDSKNSEASHNSISQNALGEDHDSLKRKTLDSCTQSADVPDSMEMDVGEGDFNNNYDVQSEEVAEDSFSIPWFLRKVFEEELGDDSGCDHKSSVVAIHAVLLESGFIGFDSATNMQIDGFQFRNEWPSNGFLLSLFYTLPDIIGGSGDAIIHKVVLKFQSLGKFLFVYGSLGNESGSRVHSVRLNEDLIVPLLNIVWANCGSIYENDGGVSSTSPEKELFKFWRNVKDNLALPLLIDLCEKAGLELPPCFIRLPTDLKMTILELLPGVDVAKVSCVCSELRHLASSDELWMRKFKEEFGNEKMERYGKWKSAFIMAWERQKNGRLGSRVRLGWFAPRRIRHSNPPMFPRAPRIIGGSHDIWPAFGGGLGSRLQDQVIPRMWNFSPSCNLGGHHGRNLI